MSRVTWILSRDTRRVAVASFYVYMNVGRDTHVDLRLPDGEFLSEVPIDYVRTLD